jgi:hypothetical protein
MSGKIKIGGLVVASALVVLGAWFAFGQASQDPCGGHYAGEGLKALFSDTYIDIDPSNPGSTKLYYSNITNDFPDYYQYKVPGGDCVYWYRNGHIVVSPNTSVNGRYVNMTFEGTPAKPQPTSPPCGKAYFLNGTPMQPTGIVFRSGGGYTGSRKANGDLVLTAMGINPNMLGMSPGQTLYCDFGAWTFTVADDPSTEYKENMDYYSFEMRPVSVYCTMVNGKKRWIFRPIPESFWIRVETKKGNKVIGATETQYTDSMYRTIGSNGYSSCYHGSFYFPFELIIEQLP